MSGIFGIFNQNGAPVLDAELARMAALLERRGPDRTGVWREGPTGLGHTLLATTPEAQAEILPLHHPASGCVITADVRLDNRDELLSSLGISDRPSEIGDGQIILMAYLVWGEDCVDRLLGDFAFAIWDSRCRKLFCARDHMGMRPLYYHHSPGKFVAIASEPRAILALPQVPYRINEGRIADFLVSQLEGIDKSSTFFEEVYRLPPAHTLTTTAEKVHIRQYWRLEPGPQLILRTREEYSEAFLDVFTKAVSCRLRAVPDELGSMLSGGLDSGSVVAVARRLMAGANRGALPTFSGISPDGVDCVETLAIKAAQTMDNLEPHCISYDRLAELEPDLSRLTSALDEPFDGQMTLIRAVYLCGHRRGVKVMLDGVGGDIVLGEGSHIARLLRRGRWLSAYRTAVEQNRFWRGAYPARKELYSAARMAFIPKRLRLLRRQIQPPNLGHRVDENIRQSFIDPDFARRVNLADRLQTLDSYSHTGLVPNYAQERACAIDHPYLTVGRERYDRVASAVAIEPRDPFLDRRLIGYCLSVPGEYIFAGGWPKGLLRHAMADLLPDEVRWRRGKEHLGWEFTQSLMRELSVHNFDELSVNLSSYIDEEKFRLSLCYTDNLDRGMDDRENIYEIFHLARWLSRHLHRPECETIAIGYG